MERLWKGQKLKVRLILKASWPCSSSFSCWLTQMLAYLKEAVKEDAAVYAAAEDIYAAQVSCMFVAK